MGAIAAACANGSATRADSTAASRIIPAFWGDGENGVNPVLDFATDLPGFFTGKKSFQDSFNKKFWEVQEPFCKRVPGRRRQRFFIDFRLLHDQGKILDSNRSNYLEFFSTARSVQDDKHYDLPPIGFPLDKSGPLRGE
jgi:hypothetical protein